MKKIYLLLMLIISFSIHAQISVRVNSTDEYSGSTLENAINSIELSSIIKLEILNGSVIEADWEFLKDNSSSLEAMTEFVVSDSIDSVANIPNTAVDFPYFNNESIESISIPKIEVIGDFTFINCSSLVSVSLPDAITIGEDAFNFCCFLTSISLPEAVDIRKNAFLGCFSLTSITLPKTINIGDNAFNNCSSLISADLPQVMSIGSTAFFDCESLVELKLSENVPSVAQNTFDTATSDRNLILVDSTEGVLAGMAYETAKANYVADVGYTTGKWYGWIIEENPCPVPELPVTTTELSYAYGDTATALSATALNNHTLNWYTVEVGGTANMVAPTPNTDSVGVTPYWVSQTSACGSDSERVKIEVEVTQKQIILTPDTDQNKVEGQVDPQFTFTVSPELIGADVLTGSLSRELGEEVGVYNYLLGDLSAGDNYEIQLATGYTFEITPDLSTEDVSWVSSVSIYPNPAHDEVNVQINNIGLKTITMYDLQGRKVLETQESTFNVRNLTDKMYLIKIENEEGNVICKKLLKN